MMKKAFHIIVICILALNLTGALALASGFDCGMECCRPGDWAGMTSYEAPSCCEMNDITCGFEAGRYEELFDTAICCFSGTVNKAPVSPLMAGMTAIDSGTPLFRHPVTVLATGPPRPAPLYLSNAAFLC